jgi:hypothetical protein
MKNKSVDKKIIFNKSLYALGSILVVAAVVFGALKLFAPGQNNSSNNDSNETDTSTPLDIAHSDPDYALQQGYDQSTDDQSQTPDTGTSDQPNLDDIAMHPDLPDMAQINPMTGVATVNIELSLVLNEEGALEATGEIMNWTDDSGICEYSFTLPNGSTITKEAAALRNPTSVSCASARLERTASNMKGEYLATVKYISNVANGNSEVKVHEVK